MNKQLLKESIIVWFFILVLAWPIIYFILCWLLNAAPDFSTYTGSKDYTSGYAVTTSDIHEWHFILNSKEELNRKIFFPISPIIASIIATIVSIINYKVSIKQ